MATVCIRVERNGVPMEGVIVSVMRHDGFSFCGKTDKSGEVASEDPKAVESGIGLVFLDGDDLRFDGGPYLIGATKPIVIEA